MKKAMAQSIFELERRNNLFDDFEAFDNNLYHEELINRNHHMITVMNEMDLCIRDWPYRRAAGSIEDYLESIGIDLDDQLDDSQILNAFELYINLLHWAQEYDRKYADYDGPTYHDPGNVNRITDRFIANAEYILEQANYAVRKVETDNEFPQYRIYKRDADVDATLECVPALNEALLSYLDVRNEKNEGFKLAAIRSIAKYLDGKKVFYKNAGYGSLYDDVEFLLNKFNIRHDNPGNTLPEDKRLKLYDEIFRASLHLMQVQNIVDFKKNVDELKKSVS